MAGGVLYLYYQMKHSTPTTRRKKMLTVTTYIINEGTKSQYFGLMTADEKRVLHYAPNNWKTRKGAENWARKHGYNVA